MVNAPTQKKCPDQTTLVEFLQGKLVPPVLDQCESHVEICDACHETLRGLNTSDTLSDYVSKAMQPSARPAPMADDAEVVGNLVRRLGKPEVVSGAAQGLVGANDVMHDRAAEVLRHMAADPEDSQSLGMLAGFRLLELIGAGGTGVVFRAQDLSLDRVVALKVLRPSLGEIARDRFITEARAAASIDHENVIAIYQVGQQDRLAWIAMQWLPGETLESLLSREAPLDQQQVRSFVTQIAQGLDAAHRRQLVHRDIKPANIWVGEPDSKIRILDFGLVRITDNDPSLTATGMLAGTPNFMSPEQAKGQELDARSDLVSLGCVMYQMLTGKLPFGSPTILATLQAIQTQQPPSPIEAGAQCCGELSDLTIALLEKEPANRIPSAQSLVKCLESERVDWPVRVARYPSQTELNLSEPAPATQSSKGGWGGRGVWVTALLLAMIAFPMWMFSPQIIRIATNQGELVIETEDKDVKVEVRDNGELIRVLDASSGSSFDIRSGNFKLSATGTDSNDEKTVFKVTPVQVVMNRGQREVVRVTRAQTVPLVLGSAQASAGTGQEFLPVARSLSGGVKTPEVGGTGSLYGGKNFEHWFQIARTDKQPKTKADAIKACGALCESESQIEQFKTLLNDFLADHATIVLGGEGTASETYTDGYSAALAALPPGHILDFVKSQVRQGSDAAVFWTGLAFNENYFNDRGPKFGEELEKEFKSNAMSILEVFPQRKTYEGSYLIFNRVLSHLNPESEEVQNRVTALLIASPKLLHSCFYQLPPSFIGDELLASIESELFSPNSTAGSKDQFLFKFEGSYHRQPKEILRPELEIGIFGIFGKVLVDQLTSDSPLAIGYPTQMTVVNGKVIFSGIAGPPENSNTFEGSVVITRRLLSMIAARIDDQFQSEGTSDLAVKVAPAIRKILSHKKYLQSKKSLAFAELQIDQDLNAILEFAAGKKGELGSILESYRTAQQSRWGNGNHRGGGMF